MVVLTRSAMDGQLVGRIDAVFYRGRYEVRRSDELRFHFCVNQKKNIQPELHLLTG